MIDLTNEKKVVGVAESCSFNIFNVSIHSLPLQIITFQSNFVHQTTQSIDTKASCPQVDHASRFNEDLYLFYMLEVFEDVNLMFGKKHFSGQKND